MRAILTKHWWGSFGSELLRVAFPGVSAWTKWAPTVLTMFGVLVGIGVKRPMSVWIGSDDPWQLAEFSAIHWLTAAGIVLYLTGGIGYAIARASSARLRFVEVRNNFRTAGKGLSRAVVLNASSSTARTCGAVLRSVRYAGKEDRPSLPLQCGNEELRTKTVDLNPETELLVDVGYLQFEPLPRIVFTGATGEHQYPPGKYRITIRFHAADTWHLDQDFTVEPADGFLELRPVPPETN